MTDTSTNHTTVVTFETKNTPQDKKILRITGGISGAVLLAIMLAFCTAPNRQKKKIEKLEYAINRLERKKGLEICDSLYKATDIHEEVFCEGPEEVDTRIQKKIDNANQDIRYLRGEAIEPILNKYPLTKFLTSEELARLNEDISARATNCMCYDSMRKVSNDGLPFSKGDFMTYGLVGFDLQDNPLDKKQSVYDLENRMHQLDYLERRPSKANFDAFIVDGTFYVQVPNENPVAKMQDGELSFTNPASQKLYRQFQREIDIDIDQKYIFNNPKFASRYCEYSAALNKAYEERETLREIGKFFDQQYQPKLDSLKFKLYKARNNRFTEK